MALFKRSSPRPTRAPASDHALVLAALDGVADPLTGRGLVESGRVQGLSVDAGRVSLVIESPAGEGPRFVAVRDAAEAAVRAVAGVEAAQVVLTAERAAAAQPARRSAKLASDMVAPGPARSAVRPDHVRHVLAVASGKGGVGKSTIAVNLALAFARRGLSVGLLDADVYGPSAPRMLGVSGRPEITAEKALIPLDAHGLRVLSIGFMIDAGAPLIWRGPMATSALTQMATGAAWGTAAAPLDVLVIDLPPGTGDIQLTLVQKIALTGAVLVSTPQALALDDVRRGAGLFAKTGVPVLGVVENMAWFETPDGTRHHPFGQGGARAYAEAAGLPYLGEVPLDPALREAADNGQPLTTGDAADVFDRMAERVSGSLT